LQNELGGEAAFENFKDRAWQRGIRIASDMVPNHTGIYSKWVIEKPDYFIQLRSFRLIRIILLPAQIFRTTEELK
jgi:glycosidase